MGEAVGADVGSGTVQGGCAEGGTEGSQGGRTIRQGGLSQGGMVRSHGGRTVGGRKIVGTPGVGDLVGRGVGLAVGPEMHGGCAHWGMAGLHGGL